MTGDDEADGAAVDVIDAPEREPDTEVPLTQEPTPPPDDAPAGPSRAERIGRRIIRRPVEWVERPWPPERIVQTVTAGLALLVTTVIMMNVVHFNPLFGASDLIFDDNTPTGGDMGAHVWGPAYLRDHLLPNFQLNGWSMDWYAGMPVYRFYMLTPALAIVALDVLLPYGVAFKLVAISGLVSLPFCCWAFGRLARFRYPMPELFAVAGMAFALQESYSIYGGNLKSTMAGEFSFSIALSLMMLGLGLLARGMETGKYRSWAAIVLALAIVSHGIVAIYTVLAALVIVLVNIDRKQRFVYGLVVGTFTILLSAFWIGPFVGNHDYMTDMKYGARPDGPNDSFWDMFFPFTPALNFLITGLAIIGFIACIARWHANGTALGVIALFTVAGIYFIREDGLPGIGLLWNPRLLPLLYLMEFLLMMVGIVEVAGYVRALVRNRSAREPLGVRAGAATFAVGALGVLIPIGFYFEKLPFDSGDRTTEYQWGPFQKKPTPEGSTDYRMRAEGSGWASYNFKGYEGRPMYPEYHDVVQTMGRIGDERGCGRATWEVNGDNGEYGTTMALMLLPFWTDGCIASMEGLFFEASGTTPYHFLTANAVSKASSNPVRELRYLPNIDAAVGVRHLQDVGSRYVMLRTPEAQAAADEQTELTLLETVGKWKIYEVAGADVVEPLTVQPVVVERRGGDQRERNLELGTSWFQHPEDWAAVPADDGPEEWQRINADPDPTRVEENKVDIVVPRETIEPVELPPVEVTDVEMGQQSLSFRVDQIGVPVLVKVSYFPNWSVEGAEGPYRIAPNFMVVIPTDNDVSMNFDRSRSDLFFYLLTLAGIVGLVLLRRRGDADMGDVVVAPAAPADWQDAARDRTDLDRADLDRADADDAWRAEGHHDGDHDDAWRDHVPPPPTDEHAPPDPAPAPPAAPPLVGEPPAQPPGPRADPPVP